MARARDIFRRPAFQWVLFLFGLVLFYWPFLAFGEQWPQPFAYFYLLSAWALVVLILFFLSRALRPRLPRDKPPAPSAPPDPPASPTADGP
ncbi:MAG: hypothetical protein V1806_11235 [Pseudomonadota bacterium]